VEWNKKERQRVRTYVARTLLMAPMLLLWMFVLFFPPLALSVPGGAKRPLVFALPCTASANTPAYLLQKPVYPPVASDSAVCKRGVGEVELWHPSVGMLDADLPHATCSCDDVHGLQRKLGMLEQEQRVLARRVVRLESITRDVVQTFQTSDDVALMERHVCSAVVYNEQLTAKRPLRLLRHELKRLQEKYALGP
jgi:hypothetical protein